MDKSLPIIALKADSLLKACVFDFMPNVKPTIRPGAVISDFLEGGMYYNQGMHQVWLKLKKLN